MHAGYFNLVLFSFSLDKLFYSLEFSEVVLTDSSNECSVPLPDYSSIIEELRNHRKEIKKLHQGCAAPGPDLEGFTFISLPPPPPQNQFFLLCIVCFLSLVRASACLSRLSVPVIA